MTDPAAFLKKIWALHGLTGANVYACASHKDWTTGAWQDRRVSPPGAARWIKTCGLPDLYFAPVLFSKALRQKEYYLPSRVLFADLDEVDPSGLGELRPTLAWQTSPGRWQGLWVLNRPIPSVTAFEGVNRRLTYATGADKGGWAGTKVLRIPGTVSTKYGRSRAKRFTVEIVGGVGPKYRLEDLMAMLPKEVARPKSMKNLFGEIDTLPDRKVVLDEWVARLPMRARQLLRTRHAVVGDDRSAKLWEMYNLLLQAGMSPAEVLVAVQGTVWNKYAGQRREMAQLQREIAKAAAKHAEPEEMQRLVRANGKNGHNKKMRGAVARRLEKEQAANPHMMPAVKLRDFMRLPFDRPTWLVKDIWGEEAHGVWGGEAKSYKTLQLLDLCISVSSGGKFLDRFPAKQGTAWYIHEEGRRDFIHDRVHRILYHKGLSATVKKNGNVGATELVEDADLPLWVTSFARFNFTDPEGRKKFENRLKKIQPSVVVLEAWYLLSAGVNDNSAQEVAPILAWLAQVGEESNCAMILSHHYHKPREESSVHKRASERLAGSGVFGRWFESAVYTQRAVDEEGETSTAVKFWAEHREHMDSKAYTVSFLMNPEDENDYRVEYGEDEEEDALPGLSTQEQKTIQITDHILEAHSGAKSTPLWKVSDALKPLNIDPREAKRVLEGLGYRIVRANRGQNGKVIPCIVNTGRERK